MSKTKNIILLHGWGTSGDKLKPLAQALAKLGWNSLVLELPGFSLQSPPPGEWGLDDYADWVYQRAKEKFGDERFFVFGHSFGGRITIKLADQGLKEIEGVILCSTAGLSRTNFVKRWFFLILAKLGKLLLLLPTPKLAHLFKTLLYKAAREHDYEKAQGIMREVFKKVISEDLRPHLKNISVPTLIIWGKLDKMTPVSNAYLVKEKILNSEVVIFQEAGHRLPYEKPKEVAKIITRWSKSLA